MNFPKSDYTYCAHDTLEALSSPPVDFWPAYSWSWCGEILDEGIVERLDSMVARGIRRLYVLPIPQEFVSYPVPGEKPYLSEEYLAQLRFAVTEAEKRGMRVWMYDEGGWPSGAANGRVVKEHPELAAWSIDVNHDRHLIPSIVQPYPDLLNRRSTELFIEYVHEKYKKAFDNRYGEHFAVTFTDEPHVRTFDEETLPWTEDFDELFRAKFGYDIGAHLPQLFDLTMTDPASRKVRADYHDLVGELFAENYFMPLRDWCRANGSLSSGHVGGDDVAFGNAKWGFHHILRVLRAMDVPGVDIIWRQAFPAPEQERVEPYAPLCRNSFFPRYASSAAHQTGARLALTESYAIYGPGLTFDQMRWVYNFQVVRGLNVLNPMNMSYTYEDMRGGYVGMPSFAPEGVDSVDLSAFNLWAARVNYLMSAGKPIADAAIYMPFRDIWPGDDEAQAAAELFEDTGSALERRGCDIDIIDDDAILAASIENGKLVIGDASYAILYIQPGANLPADVKVRLDAFVQSGGRIITAEDGCPVEPIIASDTSDLRATRRTIAEGTVYYLTNEAFGPVTGEVTFPRESAGFAIAVDLLTGERTPVSVQPYRYDLSLGGEAVLLFPTEPVTAAAPVPAVPANVCELTDFTLRPLRRVTMSPAGIKSAYPTADAVAVSLGDWQEVLGNTFSGDGEYVTEFDLADGMTDGMLLDLGQVNYSCEVFLNGESMGKRIYSPYRFELKGLRGHNELRIRVTNTFANAYADTHYEEWFPGYEPDLLIRLQRGFMTDSFPSGLFGPVKLKW